VITFYVKQDEFAIMQDGLLRNGETIATGEIFICELLLGTPALIMVKPVSERKPLLTIQTKPVTAILPRNERIWNEECVERKDFLITYRDTVSKCVDVFYCIAAHERQAEAFFNMAYPGMEIISIQSKQTLKGVI
jgi:hypothetical protein